MLFWGLVTITYTESYSRQHILLLYFARKLPDIEPSDRTSRASPTKTIDCGTLVLM